MHDKDAIDMMQRCAAELRELRSQISILAPKAEAYGLLRDLINLLPKQSQGYGEDLIWRLEKKIKELESTPVDEGADQ